jgi:hypothetical protein
VKCEAEPAQLVERAADFVLSLARDFGVGVFQVVSEVMDSIGDAGRLFKAVTFRARLERIPEGLRVFYDDE